jgi:hypothetical protein
VRRRVKDEETLAERRRGVGWMRLPGAVRRGSAGQVMQERGWMRVACGAGRKRMRGLSLRWDWGLFRMKMRTFCGKRREKEDPDA